MTQSDDDKLKPLNLKEKRAEGRSAAVAIKDRSRDGALPEITAAGYGYVAEKIVELAFQNGVKVREDKDLAHLLTQIKLESDIPSEALFAVAEILAYVYKANNAENPFDALLKDWDNKHQQTEESPDDTPTKNKSH